MTTDSQRQILILFGPPGAGKGSVSPKVMEKLGVPSLATGDMLRDAVAAQTEVGKKADDIMKKGGLVSDDIVVGIIKERITNDDCKTGFILDGFPRTVAQAEALNKMLAESGEKVTKIIVLDVPDEVLEERICGRWIHKNSGRSYHVKYCPPKSFLGKDPKTDKPCVENMLDDETGEALYQRSDDTCEALPKRLQAYHSQTVPILEFYGERNITYKINANQEMEKVSSDVLDVL